MNASSLRTYTLCSIALTSVPASSAFAQESIGSTQLEEVVVSSTKQGDTSLMRTPISVQVVSEELLGKTAAVEFNDIAKTIPGVSMVDRGPNNKRYVIRGINTPGATPTAAVVGVYYDEVPITSYGGTANGGFQADPNLVDLARVEVLKGPQGTSFGSSAMAGVVRYILNEPNTTEFGGSIKGSAISRDAGSVGYDGALTLNAPVIGDKVALRGSVWATEQPGYVDARYGDDINNYKTRGYRLQGLWKISDRAKLKLLATRQTGESGGLSLVSDTDYAGNPVPKLYQGTPERAPSTDSFNIFNAAFSYGFDAGTLTAVASRLERKAQPYWPATPVVAAALGLPRSQWDTDGARTVITNDVDQITNSGEVRFASQLDSRWQFLVGAYYASTDADAETGILTVNADGYVDPAAGVLFGGTAQERYTYTKVDELAGFAQASVDLSNTLKLTAGVRGFKFKQTTQGNVVIAPFGRAGTGLGSEFDADDSGAIGRLNLSYQLPGDHGMTYAEVAQGYRPGGANDQSLAALGGFAVPQGYSSDDLINYELGYKGEFWDRRISLTTSVFYIDWSNIQLAMNSPVTPANPVSYAYTGNAGAVRIYGAESELAARLAKGFDVGLAVGYTDAKVSEAGSATVKKGDRIPYSPRGSATLRADYEFPLTASMEGFVGGDVNWVASQWTDLSSATTAVHLPSYTIGNLRAGVNVDRWTISLLCKNVGNDTSRLNAWRPGGSPVTSWNINAPRAVVFQVSGNF